MKILFLLSVLILSIIALPVQSQVVIVCDQDGNCEPVVIFKGNIHD